MRVIPTTKIVAHASSTAFAIRSSRWAVFDGAAASDVMHSLKFGTTMLPSTAVPPRGTTVVIRRGLAVGLGDFHVADEDEVELLESVLLLAVNAMKRETSPVGGP